MTDKYDRQLNQIYAHYEQEIEQLSARSVPKRFTINPIIFLLCCNLITGLTLAIREITRPPLIKKADLTLNDVCQSEDIADVNLRITYNDNCYVIPFAKDKYTDLIDGKTTQYQTEKYSVVRRLSNQPVSQVPELYQLYLDAYDTEGNYLGSTVHNRLVSF